MAQRSGHGFRLGISWIRLSSRSFTKPKETVGGTSGAVPRGEDPVMGSSLHCCFHPDLQGSFSLSPLCHVPSRNTDGACIMNSSLSAPPDGAITLYHVQYPAH